MNKVDPMKRMSQSKNRENLTLPGPVSWPVAGRCWSEERCRTVPNGHGTWSHGNLVG